LKKAIIILILGACASLLLGQQNPDYQLLSVNDGLSQGMIYDIQQSKDGFIWIATKDGLNSYDGSRFEVFSLDPFDPFAIGTSEITQLFEDSRGWIWVLHSKGLDVLDAGSERFFYVINEGKLLMVRYGACLLETQYIRRNLARCQA
jgi:ligand-binding sensor domain-containing protein